MKLERGCTIAHPMFLKDIVEMKRQVRSATKQVWSSLTMLIKITGRQDEYLSMSVDEAVELIVRELRNQE